MGIRTRGSFRNLQLLRLLAEFVPEPLQGLLQLVPLPRDVVRRLLAEHQLVVLRGELRAMAGLEARNLAQGSAELGVDRCCQCQ